ncbi:Outer membrane lipoprotein OmlA [Roseovarius sp. AK1035]|jgi:outer membrane protein assembly factor BamE (lipoprotein component of BamABCDE complex)|uniref:outer membrane protein assembly factor BamE n=1 Tax=Roseovarius TaxID=74030 RepID=UPI0002DC32A3|nr:MULTISPECIES: outer membrane protein assembly factor BamE [Roseovarius]AWZ21838.1 Outer membrane lipoprotein OmlA [Roseovarius sp. AK1035]MBS4010344.1 outer membrane protein assembly factor BamE [Roseovarius sp.]MBW4972124.1 outer membrane protein assembly factor BamE [Roseovarius mucosus]
MTAIRNRVISALALCCLMVVTGCAATYRNHGYVPPEEDLQNLVVGVDSRATVDDVIGPPSLSGVLADGDYYYVRSRVREYGMFRPQVVERRVLAISFNDNDTIANIEEFGLEDGQVVPLARRVTDSSVVSNGFLRQLLSNIGNINPVEGFGN